MKFIRLCLMLCIVSFTSLIIAQSDDLAPVNTLLDQAETSLDAGDLTTAQAAIIGANLLITKDMMTTCTALESAKSLLDQAATMPDIERTRAVLTSARLLIDECANITPPLPEAVVISPENASQLQQLLQIGNGAVRKVRYSPTGNTYAVMGNFGVWVYDAITPNAVPIRINGTDRVLRDIVYSRDGRSLMVINKDSTELITVDIASNRVTNTIGLDYDSYSLTLSPDGRVGMLHGIYQVVFIAIETGDVLYSIPTGDLISVAWSPTGSMIAMSESVNSEISVSLWSISDPRFGADTQITRTYQLPLSDTTERIFSLTFSADGRQLVNTSYNGFIMIWDVGSGELLHSWEQSAFSLEYHPNGENFISWGNGNEGIHVWSPSGELLQEIPLTNVIDVAYHPNGRQLITLDYSDPSNAKIQQWDVVSGGLLQTRLGEQWYSIWNTSLSPDGQTIAISTATSPSINVFYDTQTGEIRNQTELNPNFSNHLVYSPDGLSLATISDKNTVLWDTNTGQVIREFEIGGGRVAFSPNGQFLAMSAHSIKGDDNRIIHIWNFEAQVFAFTLTGHTQLISDITYSPDGRFIASSDYGDTIYIWDAQTGTLLHQLQAHQGSVYALDYRYDGARMASSSNDGTIRVWDMTTNTLLMTLGADLDDAYHFYDVTYSPDGRLLAGVDTGGFLGIFDAETGATLYLDKVHDFGNQVHFTPDGTKLVTLGLDYIIRIWGIGGSS